MSSNTKLLWTPVRRAVSSSDGTPIVYDAGGRMDERAVLIVPGFWRERRHPSISAFAAQLASRGYRVAVVDVRGHGESGGVYGFNLHEHEDVAAVARDLLGRDGVSRIAIAGFSVGGAIAVSAAARCDDLPWASLVLISPVADFAAIRPRFNPFTMHRHLAFGQALTPPRFVKQWYRSEKRRAIDDVRDVHVPLCLVHAENDWLIHHRHSEMLIAAANEPKELHILDIKGCWHADRIFAAAAGRVESIVDDFLARTMPVEIEQPLRSTVE